MKKLLPTSHAFGVNKSKGFTLVELLVVVSIIAVLSVVGITLFSGVQQNARDAKRKADIDAISKALEANYTGGSTTPYPALTDAMFANGKVPTDPRTGSAYSGVPSGAVATYSVCATLEKTTGGNSSDTANPFTYSATGAYYCAKNKQ
ncbi:MAG: type II secretion system GspH family protein, partial [Candidatus Daviesbacteria bacterium]|nr:type II secretion system GspH family protein [Candidatus Daviesbacteria bacterium]